jgi:sulfatase maturation enzyme AslB (radical SAM superfamily)
MGTTTNGTIYKEELEHIIPKFKEFHLGLSIEAVTPLNDYVRYPGKITDILSNIDKFLALRENYPSLYLTLRITPNVFTVYELDKLFEYAIEKNITLEACNIMFKPASLRMEIMPDDIRQEVIEKLENLVDRYKLSRHNVINIRHIDKIRQVASDSVHEYLDFVKSYQVPDDIDQQRKNLVEFLKSFESLRNNTILEYAPRYKDFLTSIGY